MPSTPRENPASGVVEAGFLFYHLANSGYSKNNGKNQDLTVSCKCRGEMTRDDNGRFFDFPWEQLAFPTGEGGDFRVSEN